MQTSVAANPYLKDAVLPTLLKTALPIIALTSLNGLLTVVDAIFLGAFVGPDALTAVTLMFPVSMILIALATTVSTGMSSVLGRQLGAGKSAETQRSFAGAHGLSLTISLILVAFFVAFGRPMVTALTGGSLLLGGMGHTFLAISIFASPAVFLLTLHSDALRVEGRIGFMAITGLAVTFGNMAFNYALIVWLDLGVAGSALGTVIAQVLALLAILAYRRIGKTRLAISLGDVGSLRTGWSEMLALGAPRSLSFIGIALGATVTIIALRAHGTVHVDASVAAYGVITRILSFAFFPLLGISLALQAMVGNNYGAGLWERANATLKLALLIAFGYSALIEIGLIIFRQSIGGLFVADPAVAAEVARILPSFIAFYFTFGPMMIIASYFQTIGDGRRSAILSLSRTYLFAVPLTFALPLVFGEIGIWYAAPIADLLLVIVGLAILARRSGTLQWGLFRTA